jgi:predicted membrane channel-forming protein YqfA (hemolysin III family)
MSTVFWLCGFALMMKACSMDLPTSINSESFQAWMISFIFLAAAEILCILRKKSNTGDSE